MADPPHVPPPLPPPLPAAAASSQPKWKRFKTRDLRDTPGALVHAIAHNVMSKSTTVHMFGSTTTTRHSSAAKLSRHMIVEKPNAKNSQWSLRVLWNIPGYPNGKEYTILRQHAKEGPVSAGIIHNHHQLSRTHSMYVTANPCEDRQPTFKMLWKRLRRWTPSIYRWLPPTRARR